MPAPRLYGPFALSEERVYGRLQANSPGVFALGSTTAGTFAIQRIGRSDEDLRTALKAHLGGPYEQFKFTYALSPRDAFEKECQLFHGLAGLDVSDHPRAPKDTDVICPACATVWRAKSD